MVNKKIKPGYKEQIIYHYCSLEALYGIISTRSLWLTCLESTNDKKELQFGKKILNIVLQEMISDIKDIKIRNILERVVSISTNIEYKKRYSKNKYFGASFVGQKDSLTHWERYGNNGYGVCIAFNLWMIEHFFEHIEIGDLHNSWLWHNKIIYKDNLQKEYIRKSILKLIDRFNNFINNEKNDSIYNNKCFAIYSTALSKTNPIFKHSGFSDDNEYRLIFEEGSAEETSDLIENISKYYNDKKNFLDLSKRIDESIKELNLLKKEKRFGIINKSVRSFYSMNLNSFWGESLIPEIIIGPRCYQNKKELKAFLKNNRLYSTKVKISEIPIR